MNVITLPAPFRHAEPKEEPEMELIGDGKYRYAVLKDGGLEVMHRVPLHFFYLDAEKKEAMAAEICKELRKKLIRAKRGG